MSASGSSAQAPILVCCGLACSGALRVFCLLITDEVRCHIEREHGSARSVLPVRRAVVALDLQPGVHRVDHARVTDGSNAAEVVRQMGGEATTHVLVERAARAQPEHA
jgi:hypothetical protein